MVNLYYESMKAGHSVLPPCIYFHNQAVLETVFTMCYMVKLPGVNNDTLTEDATLIKYTHTASLLHPVSFHFLHSQYFLLIN